VKKLAFFSKTNVMSRFFLISFVFSPKRQFFRRIFRRKYLKNHNIGPRSDDAAPTASTDAPSTPEETGKGTAYDEATQVCF
jgi:hypothetical protein